MSIYYPYALFIHDVFAKPDPALLPLPRGLGELGRERIALIAGISCVTGAQADINRKVLWSGKDSSSRSHQVAWKQHCHGQGRPPASFPSRSAQGQVGIRPARAARAFCRERVFALVCLVCGIVQSMHVNAEVCT